MAKNDDYLTNEEWTKLIEKKRDDLIDAMKEAAILSAENKRICTVVLENDGTILLYQHDSWATSFEDVPYRLEIASFNVNSKDVEEVLTYTDEETTRSTLKTYGMTDEEIDEYFEWFNTQY